MNLGHSSYCYASTPLARRTASSYVPPTGTTRIGIDPNNDDELCCCCATNVGIVAVLSWCKARSVSLTMSLSCGQDCACCAIQSMVWPATGKPISLPILCCLQSIVVMIAAAPGMSLGSVRDDGSIFFLHFPMHLVWICLLLPSARSFGVANFGAKKR